MKLCMNCMAKIKDNKDRCPFCGHMQNEGVKSSYHLMPGTTLQDNRYLVGKAQKSDGFSVTYIGWDYGNDRAVSVIEYVPEILARRQVGISELCCMTGEAAEQYQKGFQDFLETGNVMKAQKNYLVNMAEVYDCFSENSTAYMVTEYLRGQSLQELISSGHIFNDESAKQVILAILDADISLHQLGVVHQDICTGNIMLTAEGQIKLTGPGGYRYQTIGTKIPRSSVVRNGYSAEEQYRNKADISTAVDVYSIAAVYYEMVTGCRLQSAEERLHKDQMKSFKELHIDMPVNTQNALLNSLQILSANRTRTPQELQQQLLGKKVDKVVVKNKPVLATQKKSHKGMVIAIAVACVCLAGAAVFFVTTHQKVSNIDNSTLSENQVPNLIKSSWDEASTMLSEKGMTMESEDVVVSELPVDAIVGQTPDAGSELSDGEKVTVKVSGGSEKVMTPSVREMTEEDALKALKKRNLSVDESQIKHVFTEGTDSEEVEKGSVLALLIDGEEVGTPKVIAQGSSVNLKVSAGDYESEVPELTIPDFTGQTMEEAQATADALGDRSFVVEKTAEENSLEIPAGGIIRQAEDMASGSVARARTIDGDQVSIGVVVSIGPRQIEVPDVTGKTKDEAVAAIEAAGFAIKTWTEHSNYTANGYVMYTSPKAGEMADEGSEIGIAISIGAETEPAYSGGGYSSGYSGGSSGGSSGGNPSSKDDGTWN